MHPPRVTLFSQAHLPFSPVSRVSDLVSVTHTWRVPTWYPSVTPCTPPADTFSFLHFGCFCYCSSLRPFSGGEVPTAPSSVRKNGSHVLFIGPSLLTPHPLHIITCICPSLLQLRLNHQGHCVGRLLGGDDPLFKPCMLN